MKRILTASVAILMLASGAGAASAQDGRKDGRDNHARAYEQVLRDQELRNARRDMREDRPEVRHWVKGRRLDARYRDHAHYVGDWRRHGLRAPPRGYEWRKVDNQYLLTAVATGLIASVITANR